MNKEERNNTWRFISQKKQNDKKKQKQTATRQQLFKLF